ncbi:hypothetical protein SAMN04488056_10383 [Cohaesibacter marisflavi]|uniref:Uncharacterized protein n=1 Tax=Cohaesibacter marisflavi TaxID=655353 RepID=A0A1I5E922_9HYPH|nr:hypothetical protein SAMN04488056_10383 [Cohaesibacter marisflavi]
MTHTMFRVSKGAQKRGCRAQFVQGSVAQSWTKPSESADFIVNKNFKSQKKRLSKVT